MHDAEKPLDFIDDASFDGVVCALMLHHLADRPRCSPERGRGDPAGRTRTPRGGRPAEGTTPTLIRALRASSLDLAVLTSRPPHRPFDGNSPRLHVETVADTELVVAVPSTGEFAGRTTVHVDELVAGGFGVATVPAGLSPGLPPGLSLLPVDGAPPRSAGCSWHASPANPPRRSRP
ncbi:hypothetical protein WDA79_12185 [Streptomyces sp. A475]|uniref:hypothetical protein n=1 Tax=Streptomyces sp. A475 TaxID=3131976 RepID=UPI0030C9A32A